MRFLTVIFGFIVLTIFASSATAGELGINSISSSGHRNIARSSRAQASLGARLGGGASINSYELRTLRVHQQQKKYQKRLEQWRQKTISAQQREIAKKQAQAEKQRIQLAKVKLQLEKERNKRLLRANRAQAGRNLALSSNESRPLTNASNKPVSLDVKRSRSVQKREPKIEKAKRTRSQDQGLGFRLRSALLGH